MDLIKMIPSRKKPQSGDVFVVQPEHGTYYLGRVIRTNIPSKDPMINGWSLIYLYDGAMNEKKMPKQLKGKTLLIPPQIVNNQGWLKGYFLTIGNIPISDDDFIEDVGFWDFVTKKFVNEEGNPLTDEPKIFGDYGLGSYGSVAYQINKVLSDRK